MNRTVVCAVSSRKLSTVASVSSLDRVDVVEPSLEPGHERRHQCALAHEQRLGVVAEALREHNLDEEERADIANVLDGPEEPLAGHLLALRRRPEDDAMRPAVPALDPLRLDAAVGLEPAEARVDERPRHRPDGSELPFAGQNGREPPPVPGSLDEECEHAVLARCQMPVGSHLRYERYSVETSSGSLFVLCNSGRGWDAQSAQGPKLPALARRIVPT